MGPSRSHIFVGTIPCSEVRGLHEATRVHHASRRCDGSVAALGACPTTGDATRWLSFNRHPHAVMMDSERPIFPQPFIFKFSPAIFDRDVPILDVTKCALPVEKRDVYLQRIAAMLNMRGRGRFTDSDLVEVYRLARRSRTTIQIMVAIISVPPRADASAP
jgi:hypothetical protein